MVKVKQRDSQLLWLKNRNSVSCKK